MFLLAGSDGTPAAPGHVGIVLDPATHTMIDAYETGYPVEEDTYGLPGIKREDCRPWSASPARDQPERPAIAIPASSIR